MEADAYLQQKECLARGGHPVNRLFPKTILAHSISTMQTYALDHIKNTKHQS